MQMTNALLTIAWLTAGRVLFEDSIHRIVFGSGAFIIQYVFYLLHPMLCTYQLGLNTSNVSPIR